VRISWQRLCEVTAVPEVFFIADTRKFIEVEAMKDIPYFAESFWSEGECRKTIIEILDKIHLPQSDQD
jgi:hypothetical protein